ncbi:MAG: type II toxin-antitoxin system VapC family toxin [Chloroflexi bacterium]|nr:type II toxin-antitoxin system VapC family toxin [Chloroflexota bacterium]
MNILLDTHAFLWFVEDDIKLSATARALIEDNQSRPFLSVASLWEIAIKISLGKLQLTQPYEEFIPQQLAMNGIGILGVTIAHTAAVATLPFHHRDPFDRLLAVQSNIEEMPLVSADPAFDAYRVKRVW